MPNLGEILNQASDALLSRGDLAQHYEEVRGDAAARAARLLDEARREGAEFLALAARHGVEIAREYGVPLLTGSGRRKRRSPGRLWAAAVAVLAVAAVVIATSRD